METFDFLKEYTPQEKAEQAQAFIFKYADMGEYGMAETLRQFFIQDKTLTESEAEFIFVNSDANYWHEIIVENQKLINVAQRKIDYAKNKFEDINKINL